MSKRTLFLIFALFIISFTLIMLALYKPYANPAQKQTVVSPAAPKESIAQTILSFGEPVIATSSSILRQPADINYSLPINITTGKNKVTAVQLEMLYDPQILKNVVVTPGVFLKNPVVLLNKIDAKTGRISYAFGIGLADQASIGKGIAATVNFSVKTGLSQKTGILFLPKTLVTAQDINQSVLMQTANSLLIVGVKPPASTPSATPAQ